MDSLSFHPHSRWKLLSSGLSLSLSLNLFPCSPVSFGLLSLGFALHFHHSPLCRFLPVHAPKLLTSPSLALSYFFSSVRLASSCRAGAEITCRTTNTLLYKTRLQSGNGMRECLSFFVRMIKQYPSFSPKQTALFKMQRIQQRRY